VLWRWAEQFDGVLGGGAAEGGGIGWPGVREAPLARGFTGVGREMPEPRWGGELQNPQRLVGSRDERVRQPHGQQHEIAGSGLEGLAVTAELRRAGKQVEHLVLDCGWPESVFTDWLGSQMRRALLPG
jgi:hypothetical protein